MSLLTNGPLPVTAPLVLNPLMARMVETAGFGAGYLGGGATGYQKVVLEANLNVTEMCQMALDIRAVSSLPLILDGACGYGDPMHMHRTIGMTEAARLRGHRDRGSARAQARASPHPRAASRHRRAARRPADEPDAARRARRLGDDPPRSRRARLSHRCRSQTPLLAAYAAWKKTYEDLEKGFGAESSQPEWGGLEKEMLATIDIEKLLAVERATVEKGKD
jgi:hypothetical protein